MTATTTYLRLHQSPEGIVWYGDHDVIAASSGLQPAAFIGSGVIRPDSVIRILGLSENADLVSELYRQRAGLPSGVHIQLGSPAVCSGGEPEETLTCTWYAGLSDDVPCRWFEMTAADYVTYLLLSKFNHNGGRVNDECRRILQHHPAWPAIRFLPYCDEEMACRLIRLIVDPRWFTHNLHPSRPSRLYSYLGLTPGNANAFVYNEFAAGRYYDRFKVTTLLWFPPDEYRKQIEMFSPRSFLLRVMASVKLPEQGVLSASRKFVRFARDVWLHERQPSLGLFVPGSFFSSDDERDAYIEHRQLLASHKPPLT